MPANRSSILAPLGTTKPLSPPIVDCQVVALRPDIYAIANRSASGLALTTIVDLTAGYATSFRPGLVERTPLVFVGRGRQTMVRHNYNVLPPALGQIGQPRRRAARRHAIAKPRATRRRMSSRPRPLVRSRRSASVRSVAVTASA